MSNTNPGNSKLKVDKEKVTDVLLQNYNDLQRTSEILGVNGDDFAEISPKLKVTNFETVLNGKHDSTIVLGRDRTGFGTGYGLDGNTGCASIDITVGRKSADPNFDIKNNYAYPDFVTDAARLYISQKTDIDASLGIPAGKGGLSVARSGIALKADAVRIVARENLKLVVGTDQKNSQGGTINTLCGIDLIAGNLEDGKRLMTIEDTAELQIFEIESGGMQPIPKGINTAFAFEQLVEKVDKLSAVVSTAGMIVIDYVNEMAFHKHRNLVNEYFGVPVLPSEEAISASAAAAVKLMQYTIADIKLFRMELIAYKNSHLKPSGVYYINSKYHSLN
jgi:hypothetical protein